LFYFLFLQLLSMSCVVSLKILSSLIDANSVSNSALITRKVATGVTTDTRQLQPKEIFIALSGESFDGHNFLEEAIEKGAIALITQADHSVTLSTQIPQYQVNNTLEAYQKIARWWRDQQDIPVIGVTGSVGKTTTKELIAAVLATQGKVHKTEANYNNEIGVPKTLLQLEADHDYAVIEMAMRGRGEIAELTQIAHPTIGVITNVGTAHIGRLGSEDAIAQAKCELLGEMNPSGVAILNHDNERLIRTADRVWEGETLTYGLEGGDIQGRLLDPHTLEVENLRFPLPLPGRHNALNYLAALAVAKVLGIDWRPLTEGLLVELPGARSRRYPLQNDILVLDETYNAGVESMIAALTLLKETPGKRHIAVLGTMKELGEHAQKLHAQVGATTQKLNLDHVIVLVDDPVAQAIADAALEIPSTCCQTHDEILERLEEIMQPGDRILFKASNSVGLSKVVQRFAQRYG
jgi:UDP-N-acetylmuramoyl-tripeptide--D-alanyl-D-alanine ligase